MGPVLMLYFTLNQFVKLHGPSMSSYKDMHLHIKVEKGTQFAPKVGQSNGTCHDDVILSP